jgi:glycosyltransferase involved in cell wall biosynthesis
VNVLLIGSRPLDRDGPGDAKTAFWTYKALTGAGHNVSVIVLNNDPAPLRGLRVLQALATRAPLQIGLTYSRATARRLAGLAAAPDLVVAVHARAAAHVPVDWRPRALALLIDAYGLSYATYAGRVAKPADLLFKFERRRMDRFERGVVAQFGRTAVVSELDREYLARGAPTPSSVIRVSLPVDLDFFSSTPRRLGPYPVFGFVGRLNYLPNRDAVGWLASEIWPAIRARWPKARMRVVGARPGGALRRLLARHQIELAADVPDIRPLLDDVTALLVPMRMGGGIQTKILEAMAARVPVISTGFGCRGLAAGEHLLLAETPADFARQAGRLIDGSRLAGELALAAFEWVTAQYAPAVFEREMVAVAGAIAAPGEQQTVAYD